MPQSAWPSSFAEMIPAGMVQTVVIFALIAWPVSAAAHSPIEGLGSFYVHFLHPLIVPAHALVLIGAALMFGQQGRRDARVGVLALGSAAISGVVVAVSTAAPGVHEHYFLAGALGLGILVGLDRRISRTLIAICGVIAGFAIGFDSAPTTSGLRDTAVAIAALTIGISYVTVLLAGSTVGLERDWQRVGIRIAGSWIAAISGLVLALSVATLVKKTTAAHGPVAGLVLPC